MRDWELMSERDQRNLAIWTGIAAALVIGGGYGVACMLGWASWP